MRICISSGHYFWHYCHYFLSIQFAFKSPFCWRIHIFARLSHIKQCGQSACGITAHEHVKPHQGIWGKKGKWKEKQEHFDLLFTLRTEEPPCSCQLLCGNCPQHQEPLKHVPKWPHVTVHRPGLWMGVYNLERISPVQWLHGTRSAAAYAITSKISVNTELNPFWYELVPGSF